MPLLQVGIPALAGLSVLHGLVPPHPGPLVAIDALDADLGLTLLFGLIVAIPTVIIAGPVFGIFISRRVPTAGRRTRCCVGPAPAAPAETGGTTAPARSRRPTARRRGRPAARRRGPGDRRRRRRRRRRGGPAWAPTVVTVLLPVVLMLAAGHRRV